MPASKLQDKQGLSSLKVSVSRRFFALSILSSFVLAFSLGRANRVQFAENLPTESSSSVAGPTASKKDNLPNKWILMDSSEGACVNPNDPSCAGDSEDDDDEESSSGQQLMLDIKFLDEGFLDSVTLLSNSMIHAIERSGLNLLSYHCERLSPGGVSCHWALLDGHASFKTWPQYGALLLDIFVTCGGEDPLLSTTMLPIFEEIFSASAAQGETPTVDWVLKGRGHDDTDEDEKEAENIIAADMGYFPLSVSLKYKKHVASVKSMFQSIDVFDVLTKDRPFDDYKKSLSGDGTYQSMHPELFEPDRLVFMGGMLQSRRLGDAAYHEALVHPGLLTHPNPKRVAIIGGGEGATLREILKHETIEQVVMIDIDSMIVEISKEFLPGWNNCSNLVGRSDSCFDDPRATVYLEDAFAWFKDRFLPSSEINEDPFDVIIMDALDPQGLTEFVANLYTDKYFYESLYRGLSSNGILVAQLGSGRSLYDPPEDHSIDRFRKKYLDGLFDAGFEAIREYTESSCGFGLPWLFSVSFKDKEGEAEWLAGDAEMNLKIRNRITPTVDGKSSLDFFDGSSMRKYRYPPKTSELVFCRRDPTPESCKEERHVDKSNSKVNIKVSHQDIINHFDKQGQLGLVHGDLVELHSSDNIRASGKSSVYNPFSDRRLIFGV